MKQKLVLFFYLIYCFRYFNWINNIKTYVDWWLSNSAFFLLCINLLKNLKITSPLHVVLTSMILANVISVKLSAKQPEVANSFILPTWLSCTFYNTEHFEHCLLWACYWHYPVVTLKKTHLMVQLQDYGIDFGDHKHPVKAFQCRCLSRFCRDKKKPSQCFLLPM